MSWQRCKQADSSPQIRNAFLLMSGSREEGTERVEEGKDGRKEVEDEGEGCSSRGGGVQRRRPELK